MIIKINKKTISYNSKPFIVAEISANHKNSLKNTFKLLKAAAKAKVDAVKFQTFNLNDMTLNLNKREFLIKKNLRQKVGIIERYIVFIKKHNFHTSGIKRFLMKQKD